MPKQYKKVDFHVHYLTPTYREFLMNHYGPTSEGYPTPDWDLEAHMAMMAENNITYSLLGMTSPDLSEGIRKKLKLQ